MPCIEVIVNPGGALSIFVSYNIDILPDDLFENIFSRRRNHIVGK